MRTTTKYQGIKKKIVQFMQHDPSEEEVESFYIQHILPVDKRSISEILLTNNKRNQK